MDRNVVLGMVAKSSFVTWEKKNRDGLLSLDERHSEIAVHRLNNSIALSWGLEIGSLNEPWARKYPDRNDASIHLLDIFYSGELILRTQYAAVDCARAYIPLPKANQTRVTAQNFKLIKLLNYVQSPQTAHAYFDMHFKTSGFSVVDE
jgi:hypothetical protein